MIFGSRGCGWRRAHPLAGWRERLRPRCPAGRWVRVPTSPLLSPAGPRMSSMFGKPRAGAERPPQSPLAECNVAILGCRGAGKSGESGHPRAPRAAQRCPGLFGTLGCPPSFSSQHPAVPAPAPLQHPCPDAVHQPREFFIFIFFLMFGRGKSFSAIFPERVKAFWVRPMAVAGFVCFACNACGFFFRVICGRLG